MALIRRAAGISLWLIASVAPGEYATAQEQEPTTEERLAALEREVEELRAQVDSSGTVDAAEIQRQLDAISREIETLKLGQDVVVTVGERGRFGMGPAASKVYRVQQGASLGGYGEMLYENFASQRQDGTPADQADQLDFLRAVVYLGYKFNDQILFNSEIEYEHASTAGAGSVSIEFAYLDFFISTGLGVRAGLILLPMGFINEQHEPNTFLGTTRPESERRIIPTTWRENGAGIFGQAGPLEFRAFVVNGLDAVAGGSSGATGFTARGLRGGRQRGSKAVAEDMAVVARLDYVNVRGLMAGTSVYIGNSGQGTAPPANPTAPIGALTTIWEARVQYRAHGFDLRALGTLAWVDDVRALNFAQGFTGDESIGERMYGGYVQVGYDVLRRARTRNRLLPYLRLERIDTQARVPAGFQSNPTNDEAIVTVGAQWLPIQQVVVKADYQFRSDKADQGVNQFNIALGYVF